MVPCLHQRNIYIKKKLRIWRDRKCISLVGAETPLTCAGRQSTPSQGKRYRDDNGNLRKVGWTYCHGTVFAPRQYLYQKKATGMERPEMYSPGRFKNLIYLCRPSNYLVSRESIKGREWKLAEIVVDLPPWYLVYTRAILIQKGSYRYGETRNLFP